VESVRASWWCSSICRTVDCTRTPRRSTARRSTPAPALGPGRRGAIAHARDWARCDSSSTSERPGGRKGRVRSAIAPVRTNAAREVAGHRFLAASARVVAGVASTSAARSVWMTC
jgi:hypothetical protein